MAPSKSKAAAAADKNKKQEDDKGSSETKPQEDSKPAAPLHPKAALYENLVLLERAVSRKDEKLLGRVLRKNRVIRTRLSMDDLGGVVDLYVPTSTPNLSLMKEGIAAVGRRQAAGTNKQPAMMEVETEDPAAGDVEALAPKERRTTLLPEVEAYLMIFLVAKLLEYKELDLALRVVNGLLGLCREHNRRTLELLQARAFHYFGRCHELSGSSREIRTALLAAHRSACLRFDEVGQATLINLILRNYLEHNLVDQAMKFASRASFPDHVSNNQQVRYLYYMGRIQAIQLDYSDAYNKLMQAIRKTPSHTAHGFRVAVYKLITCVQLLLGETPERAWFSDPELKDPLSAYLELVKAVRAGHILAFDKYREQHAELFAKDGNITLVARLRNSVIKTGLRRINVSYSRISFKDVAEKLDLESAESAEFVCAKAIRDGVIDASIDFETETLQSAEVSDIYCTTEPQQAFHKRIQFCMGVHDDAVKAMRYPPGAHKTRGGAGDNDDEEENKTEEDIAKEIEAELEDEEGI